MRFKLLYRIIRKVEVLYYRLLACYYRLIFAQCEGRIAVWGKPNIKNPQNLRVGQSFSINDGVYINAFDLIEIGSNVSLSAGCMLITAGLDPKGLSSGSKRHTSAPISIGSDVQIGAGAIILPGVEIGDGVVVGAGSVVTKNVKPKQVIAGNPARVLRSL